MALLQKNTNSLLSENEVSRTMGDAKGIEESTEKIGADEADGKLMNVENDNNRENVNTKPSTAEESEEPTKKELREQDKEQTNLQDTIKDNTAKKENEESNAIEGNEEDNQVAISKKGLLDLPVEIEGKRHRQKVERLSEVTTPQAKKKLEVAMGNGVALGDVPYIADQINKHSAVELKTMHRVLFGTEGKSTILKKDIRKFTGFAFAEGSTDFEKKMSMLNKLTTDQLKTIKDVLGLHLHGTQAKDALITTIMVFLMKTEDHKRKIPKGKKRKSASKTISRAKKSKSEKNSAQVDDIISNDDSKESDEDIDENTTSTKKEKAVTKKTKQSSNGESDNDSDKKAPTKSRTGTKKAYPSDLVLETVIRELLQIYDLSEVSMKQMCQKVIDKFPGSNLEERKLYLKEKIKAVLADKKD